MNAQEAREACSLNALRNRVTASRRAHVRALLDGVRAWKLDPRRYTLTHRAHDYPVQIDQITTSAQMLDLIFQIHTKAWDTERHYEVELLEDLQLIFVPQGSLCSFGASKELSPAMIRARVDHLVAEAVTP